MSERGGAERAARRGRAARTAPSGGRTIPPERPAAPTPARRARRPGRPADPALKKRRSEEILRAATEVFARFGYRRTEIGWIAERAGIAKGTVYRYFSSKRELFLAAADYGVRLLREAVNRAVEEVEDPLEQVVRAVRAYLAYFDEHPELVELIVQERAEFKDRKKPTYFEHRDQAIGRWRRLYRRLIAEGRVRAVPVSRITDVVSDLLYGTIFTNYFARRRKSFERQADDVIDILFHGILAPPAGRPPGRAGADRVRSGKRR